MSAVWGTLFPISPTRSNFELKKEEIRQMQPRMPSRGRAALIRAVTGCPGCREDQALHCLACKQGHASDIVLATALLTRYAKRGLLAPTQRLFDEMPRRDTVAFNAMLAALGASGTRTADARRLFERKLDGTPASWNTMLTCYCKAGDLASASEVFEGSLRATMTTVVSWNAMVDGYCKAGRMHAAQELFDCMGSSLRDVITWSTMMAGYLRRGDPVAAIAMFRRLMQPQTLRPTAVTMATAATACTQVGDFALGRAIHLYIRRLGTITDAVLSNALIDMYFKCGSVDRALDVFTAMPGAPNLFCWNSVIAELGMNGRGEDAVGAFRDMVEASKERNEIKPDAVTFVALLSACSHSWLVREGWEIFPKMLPVHGMAPRTEHYGCVVDLLCRAGLLDEAMRLMRTMPFRPNAKVLGCLLLHARRSGPGEDGVRVSEWAAERIAELDLRDGAAYDLSNMYASLQRWDHVEKHRSEVMNAAVAKGKDPRHKEPGRSSYDIDNFNEVSV